MTENAMPDDTISMRPDEQINALQLGDFWPESCPAASSSYRYVNSAAARPI